MSNIKLQAGENAY